MQNQNNPLRELMAQQFGALMVQVCELQVQLEAALKEIERLNAASSEVE